MKKITALIILVFQIFAIILSPLGFSQVSILIVDCNGNGDYPTISRAIENAVDGDIIRVWDGIYLEDTIRVTKMVSIIGNGSTNTIIESTGEIGIKIYSSGVSISGLSIINTTESSVHIGENAKNTTLSDINIVSKEGNGIVVGAPYVLISRCNITSKTPYGNGIILQSSSCKVTDCKISKYANGVLLIFEEARDNTILNNEIYNNSAAGIDIRLGANNNTIVYCNIYSNMYGIYIQQDSNDNIIHHNNFFNNNKNAFDSSINIWYIGSGGNYWDNYNGFDADNDGIGNIPYNISGGNNRDFYPLMTAVGSNRPSKPTNVRCLTNDTDNTPTFTWNPSYHNSGIKGYYIKIDNNPEVSIGNVLNWTSPDSIKDGSHIFYIRAESNEGTSSEYALCTFVIDTSKIDEDGDGWTDNEEEKYGTDPNDPNSYPPDRDNDHIPDIEDRDNDNDGYNDEMEISYETNPFDPFSYPKDTDKDGIPDENSPDNNYTGDIDDDNDELPDEKEVAIGTNPKWREDVERITIKGKNFYLVDINNDTVYDALYNPRTSNLTNVAEKGGNYLLDIDGDKKWDYIFETEDKTFSSYESQRQDSLTFILLLIIPFSFIPIFLFLKKRSKSYPAYEDAKTKDREDLKDLIYELRERFAGYDEESLNAVLDSNILDTHDNDEKIEDISKIEEEIDKLISRRDFTYKERREIK